MEKQRWEASKNNPIKRSPVSVNPGWETQYVRAKNKVQKIRARQLQDLKSERMFKIEDWDNILQFLETKEEKDHILKFLRSKGTKQDLDILRNSLNMSIY